MEIKIGTKLRRYDPQGERFTDFVVTRLDAFGRGMGLTAAKRNVPFGLNDVRKGTRADGSPRFMHLGEETLPTCTVCGEMGSEGRLRRGLCTRHYLQSKRSA